MLKQGQYALSYYIRNVAECALDFSYKLGRGQQMAAGEELQHLLEAAERLPAVAVIGDPRAGKSSVLDLLINPGRDTFAKMSRCEPVLWWRFDANSHGEVPSVASTAYYPHPLLRNIELVDTYIEDFDKQGDLLKKALERVDVILVVLPATIQVRSQESLWAFISSLPVDYYDRMIIVLTHADECSFNQIEELKTELREFCRNSLGVTLAIYYVYSGGNHIGNGAEVLVKKIDRVLALRLASMGWNRRIVEATQALLKEQNDVLNKQRSLLRIDAGVLARIDSVVMSLGRQVFSDLPKRLETMADMIQAEVPVLVQRSAYELGKILSINRVLWLSRVPSLLEWWFSRRIARIVEERQEIYNRGFLHACRRQWNEEVRPRVINLCDIGEFPEEQLANDLNLSRARLGKAVADILRQFKLRSILRQEFNAQKKWMKRQLYVVLLLITAGGILGGLGESLAGFALVGCAALIWCLTSLALVFVKIKFARKLEKDLDDFRKVVMQELAEPLRLATIGGVWDYQKLYVDIHRQATVNAQQIQPLIDEYHSLYRISTVLLQG